MKYESSYKTTKSIWQGIGEIPFRRIGWDMAYYPKQNTSYAYICTEFLPSQASKTIRTTVKFIAAVRTISDSVAELSPTNTSLIIITSELARTTVFFSGHIYHIIVQDKLRKSCGIT